MTTRAKHHKRIGAGWMVSAFVLAVVVALLLLGLL